MVSKDIKLTIQELHQSLEKTDSIDPETRDLLRQLDQDMHRVLASDQEEGATEEGLHERLEALAADFDSRHPQLAGILRELGVALARVGI